MEQEEIEEKRKKIRNALFFAFFSAYFTAIAMVALEFWITHGFSYRANAAIGKIITRSFYSGDLINFYLRWLKILFLSDISLQWQQKYLPMVPFFTFFAVLTLKLKKPRSRPTSDEGNEEPAEESFVIKRRGE